MAKHTVPVTSYVRFLGIAEVVFPQNAAWQNVDFLQLVSSLSRERGRSQRLSSIPSLSVIHGNFKPSAEPAPVVRGKRTDDLQQPSQTSKKTSTDYCRIRRNHLSNL